MEISSTNLSVQNSKRNILTSNFGSFRSSGFIKKNHIAFFVKCLTKRQTPVMCKNNLKVKTTALSGNVCSLVNNDGEKQVTYLRLYLFLKETAPRLDVFYNTIKHFI